MLLFILFHPSHEQNINFHRPGVFVNRAFVYALQYCLIFRLPRMYFHRRLDFGNANFAVSGFPSLYLYGKTLGIFYSFNFLFSIFRVISIGILTAKIDITGIKLYETIDIHFI